MIAWLQVNRLGISLEQQLGFALQHDHPLALLLIVPEAIGTGMPRGDDAFDARVLAFCECLDEFLGRPGRQSREEIGFLDQTV